MSSRVGTACCMELPSLRGRDGRLPFVTLADLTLAPLSGVTNVRLGIADGGHGIFAVDGPDGGS